MGLPGRAPILATAIVATLLAGRTFAARLPDWAEELAESAPEIPAELSDHPSRVLFSETVVSVEPDGTLRTRQRRATQALSNRADDVGLGYFFFDDRTRILTSKGWHLPPEGRAKKSRGGALDLVTDDLFSTDQKTRFIGVDGIEKGSLVFFEFEALDEPYDLGYQHLFYEGAPTDLTRFVALAPPGWSVRHAFLRQEGPEPEVSEGRWSWELRDLETFEEDSLGESPLDVAPLLVVGFTPPADRSVPTAHENWSSVASWFEELAAGRDEITPEIEAVAQELLLNPEPGFYEQVRLAGTYVRDRVRYVAREIGVEGYRPRPAGQVLERLYGDCKDKGTLLRALLQAAGHASYPILVNTSMPGTVSERVPSLQAFNHFVVGVPVPDEPPVPEAFRPALIEAGGLGRLLVVDTTDEYGSVGSLRAYLAGKTALVVAGADSRLVSLPADNPDDHRIEKRLDAEVADDLSVTLHLEVRRYGDPAARARHRYRQSVADYREAVANELTELWPASRLEDFEVVDETADGSFIEQSSVRLAPPKDPEHVELFPVFPGALDGLPRVSLRRRETPVRYPHAITLRYDSTIRGASHVSSVLQGTNDGGDGWAVASAFSKEADRLKAHWEMELSHLSFEPAEFDELNGIWRSARRTSGAVVPR